MQLLVILGAVLACVSQVTLATVPVDPAQLANWQTLFTQTGGATWLRCKNKFDSPCTCEGTVEATVTCTIVDGTNFITSIRLKGNNLAGATYPSDTINALIGGFAGFTTIDLRTNAKLKNPGGNCLPIPNCAGKSCKFDFAVCTSTAPPVVSVAPTASAPTATKSPTVAGKTAWTSFFGATGGATWNKCTRANVDPCLCQANQPPASPIRVGCTGTIITKISLIDNNLVADQFPAADVSNLISSGTTFIDLTNNAGLAPLVACFDVPECLRSGVTCAFDKPVCNGPVVTASPTANGSTTTAPSISTSSPSTGTSTPTVQTTAPTSKAPTTASPTTAGPTTSSPTTPTLPPGVTAPPTTSLAPTTMTPTTMTPTTVAPTTATTNGTIAPTARNATSSPVTIGTITKSPTASMASSINGVVVSAAVTLMAVIMM